MEEVSPVGAYKDIAAMKRQKGHMLRDNVPSVHGRGYTPPTTRTRLSTHQRNLSLDFRSMGILLPPIAQVTTVTSNHLTLHHRNRSLDSALQRIPEVDVTPSPECETVTTILTETHPCKTNSSVAKTQRDELASLGSDDSGILCGSDSGSSDTNNTRESSVEYLSSTNNQSQESLDAASDTSEKAVEFAECQIVKIQTDTGDYQTNGDLSDSKKNGIVRDEREDDPVENSERISQQVSVTCNSNSNSKCKAPPPQNFGLLRLLESKVFDVPMAMHYLSKSKEPGVQSYIANKMFSFLDSEVDFYLPQLVCMYIQMLDVAEVIHPYLAHR
ncbi:hypothetical protein AMK59_5304 [Oryctes borbonicus]|uniref:PI4KB/PIK1 accessory domain-containing protein n=1 Tax=Oryctes borbonicus TaxID=1629725 RepID=A0A0T6B3Z7_9SCAR|nr:hypothetical protein AMK59_5304 [Oryctes borbonicus]